MSLLLGCIADDFTGATDLASMLVRHGMATVQLIGVPGAGDRPGRRPGGRGRAQVAHDRRRGRDPPVARRARVAARAGAPGRSCSSTARPSIRPTAATSGRSARRCSRRSAPTSRSPARPCPRTAAASIRATCSSATSCSSDTHMRHHPLTPMTDSNLVAVLQRQSRAPVGLRALCRGRPGRRRRSGRGSRELRRQGIRQAIADAVSERHLIDLGTRRGRPRADHRRLRHRDGAAGELPPRRAGSTSRGRRTRCRASRATPRSSSGSCSAATLGQVERHRAAGRPALVLDPIGARRRRRRGRARARLRRAPPRRGAGPDQLLGAARGGRARAGAARPRARRRRWSRTAMAAIAKGLVARGVRRLVVAGGETAGAVVDALGVEALKIGPPIDPGVPWTLASASPRCCWRSSPATSARPTSSSRRSSARHERRARPACARRSPPSARS